MQVVSSKAEIFDGRTLGRHATEGRDQCIRKSAFAPTSAAPRECRTHRGALERHSSLLPKGRYKIGSSKVPLLTAQGYAVHMTYEKSECAERSDLKWLGFRSK
jgi:hypothetical protein